MTIPASAIVKINPGVIGGGGSALVLNGVILTNNAAIPMGKVQPFASADAVGKFFGPSSVEKTVADKYFAGFNNSTVKPGNVFFSQYAAADVSGYLRGGSVAALTLAALQALTGILTVTVDGTVKTSSTVNLSAATSFSNAATLIQAGFTSLGGTVSYDAQRGAFVITSASTGAGATYTGAIATTTMTVTGPVTGKLSVGQVVSGTGVTAGTVITALGTGTGGAGTYTVAPSQTAASTAMVSAPSSVGFASGSLATPLNMTAATGAVLSAGAVASVPGTAMDAVKSATLNWAAFMTIFEPVLLDKLAFAQWVTGQNNRFSYVAWDTSVTAVQSGDTTGFGPQLNATGQSGTVPISGDSAVAATLGVTLASMLLTHAAFVLGSIASIDFARTNGRITFAFKGQTGLNAAVSDETVGAVLMANGYNFYGAYATANQAFVFFYPGSVPGAYLFLDEYINQIWLNNQLQLALLTLLTGLPSIPYNSAGYSLINAACMDPIRAALNFGAIRENVPLSDSQKAQVNNGAGQVIDPILSTVGYYLQILPATAQVRAARGTPPMTLWYMDGGAVQNITLASIVIQ